MKAIIDYVHILGIFFKKYLPAAIRESRDDIMNSLGQFLIVFAGVMLFLFCIFGSLLSPIAYYCYVAVMTILAFVGLVLKAMFNGTNEDEENEQEKN